MPIPFGAVDRAAVAMETVSRLHETPARRALKHGSMYHIWPTYCQTQLRGGEIADDRDRNRLAETAAKRLLKLAFAIFSSVGGDDHGLERPAGDRRLDLGKAGKNGARLEGQAKPPKGRSTPAAQQPCRPDRRPA